MFLKTLSFNKTLYRTPIKNASKLRRLQTLYLPAFDSLTESRAVVEAHVTSRAFPKRETHGKIQKLGIAILVAIGRTLLKPGVTSS